MSDLDATNSDSSSMRKAEENEGPLVTEVTSEPQGTESGSPAQSTGASVLTREPVVPGSETDETGSRDAAARGVTSSVQKKEDDDLRQPQERVGTASKKSIDLIADVRSTEGSVDDSNKGADDSKRIPILAAQVENAPEADVAVVEEREKQTAALDVSGDT